MQGNEALVPMGAVLQLSMKDEEHQHYTKCRSLVIQWPIESGTASKVHRLGLRLIVVQERPNERHIGLGSVFMRFL